MSLGENTRKSCDLILNSVRYSNLNFSVTETPFPMYFTIRKSFIKNQNSVEISSISFNGSLADASAVNVEKDNALKALVDENEMLKKVTSESIDQIKILKSKVEAAEVVARKWESQIGYCEEIVKKKISEIENLKQVIKANKSEYDDLNAEHKKVKKMGKSQEKIFMI